MQLSFSYEVSEWNSAMYPGPDMSKTEGVRIPLTSVREADPGFKQDSLWVCTLCNLPVMDDKGVQKRARTFEVSTGPAATKKEHKQPLNWYHCDPCRKLSRDDKHKMSLMASAEGTTHINKMFDVARKW
jgi:hypothetical protein